MVEDWRPFLQTESAIARDQGRETHCIQRNGHDSQVSIHVYYLGRQPYAEVVVSNAVLNFREGESSVLGKELSGFDPWRR